MSKSSTANIDDQTAKDLATLILTKVGNANSADDVKGLLNGSHHLLAKFRKEINDNRPDPSKYPKIHFSLTQGEIVKLKQSGMIGNNSEIVPPNAETASKYTTLEKVLYSILWKNGDISKVHNFVRGISEDTPTEVSDHAVFWYFGKHVSKAVPFILDQHTFRVFAIDREKLLENVSIWRSIETVKFRAHRTLINDYISFFESLKKDRPDSESYFYEVDQLLFAVGRILKKKRPSKDPKVIAT